MMMMMMMIVVLLSNGRRRQRRGHLGHTNVSAVGDGHRVDQLARRVVVVVCIGARHLQRSLGRRAATHVDALQVVAALDSEELHTIARPRAAVEQQLIAHVQRAVGVHAALERVAHHARLVAEAETVRALVLELDAGAHDLVGDEAMIARVAHEQRVIARGHTARLVERVRARRSGLDQIDEREALVEHLDAIVARVAYVDVVVHVEAQAGRTGERVVVVVRVLLVFAQHLELALRHHHDRVAQIERVLVFGHHAVRHRVQHVVVVLVVDTALVAIGSRTTTTTTTTSIGVAIDSAGAVARHAYAVDEHVLELVLLDLVGEEVDDAYLALGGGDQQPIVGKVQVAGRDVDLETLLGSLLVVVVVVVVDAIIDSIVVLEIVDVVVVVVVVVVGWR